MVREAAVRSAPQGQRLGVLSVVTESKQRPHTGWVPIILWSTFVVSPHTQHAV